MSLGYFSLQLSPINMSVNSERKSAVTPVCRYPVWPLSFGLLSGRTEQRGILHHFFWVILGNEKQWQSVSEFTLFKIFKMQVMERRRVEPHPFHNCLNRKASAAVRSGVNLKLFHANSA